MEYTQAEGSSMEKKKAVPKNKVASKGADLAGAGPADDGTFPIVGVGASAGGLAAFEQLFSGMPAEGEPGMAFVLVQHLAPDHQSILAELIRRYTRMQVFEVVDLELVVKLLDGSRADAGDRQESDQARRNFDPEVLVVSQPAGPREFLELLRDGLPYPRNPRRAAVSIGARDFDRRVSDRVGRLVVGHGLEDELAPDLEHVPDLVEDARQLAIR